MKVQLVTSYRVSHLQRYGVKLRGNVTSVDPPTLVTLPRNVIPYRDSVEGTRDRVTNQELVTRPRDQITNF